MAIQKRPYELSVWVEKLNGSGSKTEEKGIIIGANDIDYPGKATGVTITRELKGSKSLSFQMVDKYFDPFVGDYVHNDFIDMLSSEVKVKLNYKGKWHEFTIKSVDEKKVLHGVIKTFTCQDACIDELARNGYGITYDTELYNNVEEIGDFSRGTLKDSIWRYAPENNWGDFTEFKEERLFKIPISCFGGAINAHRLSFRLEEEQIERIRAEKGTDKITNAYTDETRIVELSDDLANTTFWDEYTDDGVINPLNKEYVSNVANDGYLYVPYSCLSFCYGQDSEPDFSDTVKYDRAATETAIEYNGKLLLAPPSVDPRTIIQFYAIPSDAILELDEDGVILNKEYTYYMTLAEWNRAITWSKLWYIFEDTHLVRGEILGSADIDSPYISHTFKYLKDDTADQILDSDFESRGNRCVWYEGYLSDVNDHTYVKGKKFSITNRTAANISEEIDQYATVYNCRADEFTNEYNSEEWDFAAEPKTSEDKFYRVCSKIATRQIVPQLARNLVQNGTDMDSVDGWSAMSYLQEDPMFITPTITHKGLKYSEDNENIDSSVLVYNPAQAQIGYKWSVGYTGSFDPRVRNSDAELGIITFMYEGVKYPWDGNNAVGWCDLKRRIHDDLIGFIQESQKEHNKPLDIYAIGMSIYYKGYPEKIINGDLAPDTSQPQIYKYLCDKNDFVYKALKNSGLFVFTERTDVIAYAEMIDGKIQYDTETTYYQKNPTQNQFNLKRNDTGNGITIVHKEGTISEADGQEVVNFGIVGQEKKIEKDKIYCLGVQAWATKEFQIKIGKGSLISDGKYSLVDSTTLTFDLGPTKPFEYPIQEAAPQESDDSVIIGKENLPPLRFILFKVDKDIENPYFVIDSPKTITLMKLYLFEAYTKGIDCFPSNEATYRYSGRDLFWPPKGKVDLTSEDGRYHYTEFFTEEDMKKLIIFEDQIMLGSTYEYQQYFIQRLKVFDEDKQAYIKCDTMGAEKFLSSDADEIKENALPLDAAKYTDEDYVIETNYIDLNKCPYYIKDAEIDQCDCGKGTTCFYQKFGYCPHRFKTEKHDRRIRTLSVEKSNRFNIIQEISKVFKVYPQFYAEHNPNGSLKKDTNGNYIKKAFYITEKGNVNQIGFRYGKNLKEITRNITSDQIVSKLYVMDVDSEISKTGLCSIKTAEDNPSKDSFIIDLSYYIQKGMLDKYEVEQDLYGIEPSNDEIPAGYLYQLGYYNKQYDDLSNKIINLQDASYTELEANLTVNYQAIITSQEQILKIKKQLDRYRTQYGASGIDYEEQQAYKSYLTRLAEQQSILTKLIYSTFYTDGKCDTNPNIWSEDCFDGVPAAEDSAIDFFSHITDFDGSKDYWIDKHSYTCGILGQYNQEYLQIQQWKRERASYLKLINQISAAFYKKYEPYLKEGTWSDDNYLTDNAYYFGALDVAAEGAIPKVQYGISVIDLAPLGEEYDMYNFEVADITFVEDEEILGTNKRTGLPNRLKVLISATTENIDDPARNTIMVQNYTTSFQDLFQQISATVQNLTYNENIYKRSSNFTSLQNIKNDSLQGALDTNELMLINTDEDNIQVDSTGTHGSDINNHANKYKLNGQGLFFSNDGGQHWSVGVGPSGINADYIRVGTLDAGKIRIADSSYVYFSWDKNGISAYRDPASINTDSRNANDAAIFNKFGLSIVNNGHIKLRAGYNYTGQVGSDKTIATETQIGDEVGFYLYNSAGQVIFRTATSTKTGAEASRETAAINLVGEMFITNDSSISVATGYNYSNEVTFNNQEYFGFDSSKLVDGTIESDIIKNGNDFTVTRSGLFLDNDYLAYILNNNSTLGTITIKNSDDSDSIIYTYNQKTAGESAYIQTVPNGYSKITKQIATFNYIEDGSTLLKTIRYYSFEYYQNGLTSKPIYKEDNLGVAQGTFVVATVVSPEQKTYNTPAVELSKSPVVASVNEKADNSGFMYGEGTSLTVYEIGGTCFRTYLGNDVTPSDSGSVGLYLNNKIDLGGNSQDENGKSSRLFTCCSSGGEGELNNILSILKNGSLYIGGSIDGQYDTSSLEDKIKINNAGILITSDGKLVMNFEFIKGADGGSLTDYIGKQIANSQQGLTELMNKIASNATSGLASSDHSHWLRDGSLAVDHIEGLRLRNSPSGDNQYIKIEGSGYAPGGYVSASDFINWVRACLRVNNTYVQ